MESIMHFLLTGVNYIIKLWRRLRRLFVPAANRVLIWHPHRGVLGFRPRNNIPVESFVCGGRALFVQLRNNGIYLLMFQLPDERWVVPGSAERPGNVTETDGDNNIALSNAAWRVACNAWTTERRVFVTRTARLEYNTVVLHPRQHNCLLVIFVTPFTPEPAGTELGSGYLRSAWMKLTTVSAQLYVAGFTNHDTRAAITKFMTFVQQ